MSWLTTVISEGLMFTTCLALVVLLRPQATGLFYLSAEEMLPMLAMQNLLQEGDLERVLAEFPASWDLSKTLIVKLPVPPSSDEIKGDSLSESSSGEETDASSPPSIPSVPKYYPTYAVAFEVEYEEQELKDK